MSPYMEIFHSFVPLFILGLQVNVYEFSKSPQKTSLRWPQGRETCSESEKKTSM